MSPIKSYNHDMALANILMKELTIGVVNKVRRSDLYTGGSESPPFRTKHGRKLRQTPSEKPWSGEGQKGQKQADTSSGITPLEVVSDLSLHFCPSILVPVSLVSLF